jgi:hypothetical protein
LGREIGRGTATEIDVLGFAARNVWAFGVLAKLLHRGRKVTAYIGGVLVGIDPEVTKVAALPTKRHMIVETKGSVAGFGTVQKTLYAGSIFLAPEGKRWIVGYEIISRLGVVLGLDVGFYESVSAGVFAHGSASFAYQGLVSKA